MDDVPEAPAPSPRRKWTPASLLAASLTFVGGATLTILLYFYNHHSCQTSAFTAHSAFGRFCGASGQLGLTLAQFAPAAVTLVAALVSLRLVHSFARHLVLACGMLAAIACARLVVQAITGLPTF